MFLLLAESRAAHAYRAKLIQRGSGKGRGWASLRAQRALRAKEQTLSGLFFPLFLSNSVSLCLSLLYITLLYFLSSRLEVLGFYRQGWKFWGSTGRGGSFGVLQAGHDIFGKVSKASHSINSFCASKEDGLEHTEVSKVLAEVGWSGALGRSLFWKTSTRSGFGRRSFVLFILFSGTSHSK